MNCPKMLKRFHDLILSFCQWQLTSDVALFFSRFWVDKEGIISKQTSRFLIKTEASGVMYSSGLHTCGRVSEHQFQKNAPHRMNKHYSTLPLTFTWYWATKQLWKWRKNKFLVHGWRKILTDGIMHYVPATTSTVWDRCAPQHVL